MHQTETECLNHRIAILNAGPIIWRKPTWTI